MRSITAGLLLLTLSITHTHGSGAVYSDTSEDAYFVSQQGVARVDGETHQQVWRVLEQKQIYELVATETLVLAGGPDGIYAIDRLNGDVRWQLHEKTEVFAPVLYGDTAYIADRKGVLRAVNASSGEEYWRKGLGDGWIYPPAVIGDLLVTGGQDTRVWALDANTGVQRWVTKLEQELVYRPVATGNERVVVTTFSGDVIALDAADGGESWRASFATPSLSPILIDSNIVMGSLGGVVRALNQQSGELVWDQALGGRLIAPIMEKEGVLLALTDGSKYHFLKSDTGEVIRQGQLSGEPMGGRLLSEKEAIIFLSNRNSLGQTPVLVSSNND